jgi:hypothetical protein
MDTVASTITITGKANTFDIVNTYIDTLKFTTYQAVAEDGTAEGESKKAFSNVVLSQFARDGSGTSYTVNLTYDPVIFNNTTKVKLTVPKIISTRSLTEQPTDLFDANEGEQ